MANTANFNVDTSVFTIRNPRLKPWHLVLIGTGISLILVLASEANNPAVRNMVSILVSSSVVMFLYLIQKYIYDEKTATEFQCLIFSGSMRANSLISLILNRDGSIYYLDSRYTMNFDAAKHTHNLEQFMNVVGVPAIQQQQIYDSMNGLKQLETTYSSNNQQLKLCLYPILRPEGFFSISLMPLRP